MKLVILNHISHKRPFLFISACVGLLLLLGSLQSNAAQDEQLIFSTYLGGDLADTAAAIATDSVGNVYITGTTQSILFPAAHAESHGMDVDEYNHGMDVDEYNHGMDVFVAKFNSSGSTLEYVLWFNAINAIDVDEGYGITVDNSGSAYVTGHTRSADFCTLFGDVPGYDKTHNGDSDAFLLKVKPDGSGLDYCTFLGGDDWDIGRTITLDTNNNAIVSGATWSTDFPITNDAIQSTNAGQRDIFIARLDASGTELSYASYWGGTGQEETRGMALGTNGNLALTGWSNSADLPTNPDSFAPDYGGEFDGFLLQLTPDLDEIDFATYLGGSGEDRATAVVLDNHNTVTVSGYTLSSDFPISPSAYQTNLAGDWDSFVLRLGADARAEHGRSGRSLIYSTYLGGSEVDESLGLTVDTNGIATIIGTTDSIDFPTTPHAFSPSLSGDQDVFMAQISPGGNQLLYGSFLGGEEKDGGTAVTQTTPNSFILTGSTRSPDFPTTPGAYDTRINGDYDIFVTQLAPISEALLTQIYLPLITN